MKKIEKRMYALILKEAAKYYGVHPIKLTEKQPAGRTGMVENIKLARSLYLLTVKQVGLKHNTACSLININQGNATTYRKKYEEQFGNKKADEIAMKLTEQHGT